MILAIATLSSCASGSGSNADSNETAVATVKTGKFEDFCGLYHSEKAAYIAKYEQAQASPSNQDAGLSLLGALVGTADAMYDIQKMFQTFEDEAPDEIKPDLEAINQQLEQSMDLVGAVDSPLKALTKSVASSFQAAPAWGAFDTFLVSNCGEAPGALFGVSGTLATLDQYPGYGATYSSSAIGRVDDETRSLSILLAATDANPVGGEVVSWTPSPKEGAEIADVTFDLAEQEGRVTAIAVARARVPASGLNAASEDIYLSAFDVRANKATFSTLLPGDARFVGVADNFVVVYRGSDNTYNGVLEAYSTESGERLWSRSGFTGRAAVTPHGVVATHIVKDAWSDVVVTGLDARSGRTIWTSKIDPGSSGVLNTRYWPGGDVVFQGGGGLVQRASDGKVLVRQDSMTRDDRMFYDAVTEQIAVQHLGGLAVVDVKNGKPIRKLAQSEVSVLGLQLEGFYGGNLWLKTSDTSDVVDARTGDVVVTNWVLRPRSGGKTWVVLDGGGKRGARLFDDGKFDPAWTTTEEGVS